VNVARVLLLSPHFDDVPLSLGQSLTDGHLRGHDVTVVVVFSRTNWTQWFHPALDTPRILAASAWRRGEEAVAGRRFRYRVRTLGLPEWMLRTGRSDLEGLLDPSVDVTSDPTVEVVLDAVGRWVAASDAVAVCAAVGHHVDHQVVREVGARLAGRADVDVAFYEDRPYAAIVPPDDLTATGDRLAVRLARPVDRVAVSGPVTPELHRRLRRTYPSQIDELFTTAMAADATAGAVERVWVPAQGHGFWPVASVDR